jgi:DME family drug/metabolite transporter
MLWGTSGSVMALLAERAATSPLLVAVSRLWVAALLLLVAALVTGRSLAVAHRDRWRCVAMGACMAAYQAAYFPAVTLSGIAIVALVAICSAPLVIAALAPWLLGERQSRPVHVALGLGVLGTALLVAAPGAALPPRFVGGALLALVAGLAYALYVLAAKASLVRSAPLPLAAVLSSRWAGRGYSTSAPLRPRAPTRCTPSGFATCRPRWPESPRSSSP